MASEEDGALLRLIHRHLQVNGYLRAAKVLEKHVAQVETAEQSFNLQDIYTGWTKLCSLARHTKQEAGDSTTLETNGVKAEPATSDKEACADTKLGRISEEDVEAMPALEPDGVQSSRAELPCWGEDADAAPEHLPDVKESDNQRSDCSDSAEEEGEEEPKAEQEEAENSITLEKTSVEAEPATRDKDECADTDRGSILEEDGECHLLTLAPVEVFAEASNKAESCSSDCCDTEDQLETNRNDPTLGTSNQAVDQPQTPSPPERSGSDGERSEENQKDDEPKQEKEDTTDPSNVTGETSASEQTAASQTEATAPCTQEEDVDRSAEQPSLVELESNYQPAESEAPPAADPGCEKPKDQDLENDSKDGGRTSPLEPEDQVKLSTAEPHITDTGKVRVVAAEEPADPEDSIVLNIQEEDGEAPVEPVESCKDSRTPKKKKRSKETEAPPADALCETPLTSTSAKKKKRDKKRHEEVTEEDEALKKVDDSLVAPPKKSAKKRKREKDKVEKDEESPVTASENKIKKNKFKEEMEAVKEENPASPADTRVKKQKKKNRKKKGEKEVQSDEQPVGGNEDAEKKLYVSDGNASQPSTKKHRLRKKLSLKKRLRLHKKEERRRKRRKNNNNLAAGQTETTNTKKQKRIQDATEDTSEPKPTKRPRPDSTQEENSPKKKKKRSPEQEENSSKENQPPKTKKEKKKMKLVAEDDELNGEFPAIVPSPQPKTKKKKKKKTTAGQAPDTPSQDPPAKKKKNRFQEKLEEAEPAADTDTPASKKKKKKSPKRKIISD